jgi:2-polyprenyl-3-methyl-5-hydroxy-6-metoxy-1,4-benzoquinol methylase
MITMQSEAQEKIEILSVQLLDENRPLVSELKRLARSLKLEFGWHYLLDLCWLINNLGVVNGRQIVDAGAGIGIIQWYLAQAGAQVLSVDRNSRASLPLRFRRRFRVSSFKQSEEPLNPPAQTLINNLAGSTGFSSKLSYLQGEVLGFLTASPVKGSVSIFDYNLQNLEGVPANSVDAVVAVSALEHNSPDNLKKIVKELMRVIKPGGMLLATLGASRDQDWFHEASQGWCYTEASLRNLFDLSPLVPSNYKHYDDLFDALYNCAELRDNMANFYYRSGDNGMPWGVWNPRYQSVGIHKLKRV